MLFECFQLLYWLWQFLDWCLRDRSDINSSLLDNSILHCAAFLILSYQSCLSTGNLQPFVSGVSYFAPNWNGMAGLFWRLAFKFASQINSTHCPNRNRVLFTLHMVRPCLSKDLLTHIGEQNRAYISSCRVICSSHAFANGVILNS